MPKRCETVKVPGGTAIICSAGGRWCEFCRKRNGDNQCDHLTGGPCKRCKGTGKSRGRECHPCAGKGLAMCNRFFCGVTCGVRISKDEGYCPMHKESNQKLEAEEVIWIEGNDLADTHCLRRSCRGVVPVGAVVLFFPKRERVMHEDCGKEYLRLTGAMPT